MRMFLIVLIFLSLMPIAFAEEPKPPDACKLLTGQDVQSVLGAGYSNLATPMQGSDYSVCLYKKTAGDLAGLTVLGTGGMGAAAALEGRMKMSKSAVAVPEVGPGAWVATVGTKMGLNFGKGNWQATLEAYTAGKPDVEAAKKLAKTILSRMP